MAASDRLILIAGATGYVGGRLIPELLERGERVRALARTPGKLRSRPFHDHPNLEVVRGDVTDQASVRAALDGVQVAYYLVHSMTGNRDFARTDLQAARVFAAACAAAGVERIVYLSALGGRTDAHLSHHLASRHETGDALRSAGVPVTELRAAIVVGSGSASYEIIRDLVHHLPVMIGPRWLRSRCEPIAIRDVVEYLVRVLDEPRTVGQSLDIGGGEILTYQQMIELFAAAEGTRRIIIPVPLLSPRLSSWWLHLVTRVDFTLAQPLVEGLRSDAVTEDQRIRDWIPLELTPYTRALELAQQREREPERWSSWTDAGRGRDEQQSTSRHLYRDYRTFDVDLDAEQLFARLRQIGGRNGYGAGVNVLWRLRGALDRIAGGPGLRRGRPRGPLTEGDPVDFWRVDQLREPDLLVLIAEMLAPGEARLEWRIEQLEAGRSRLHQTATLRGRSWWTSAYWMVLRPLHAIVFPQLGRHVISIRSPG